MTRSPESEQLVLPSGNLRHPSRNLAARVSGYGIAAGFEKPYRKDRLTAPTRKRVYGPLPHAGYYGSGTAARPFARGEAGFSNELAWYKAQYGEETSDYNSESSTDR
jgi:hypothetical protein